MRRRLVAFLFGVMMCGTLGAEARTALVIGNGDYKFFSSLAKPVEEAQLLAATLEQLGFEVILVADADKETMTNSLRTFRDKIKAKGGVALFHYGGHAVQVNGKNYLIPVDADIDAEYLVETRAVNAAEVLQTMEYAGAEANIVILDSCRNNPLPGEVRDGTRGLAVVGRKPKNSIIVYSAESGTVARDGVFTPVFVDMLQKPGLDLAEVVMRTRKEVYNRTGGKQTPGEYNQLFDPIYLNGMPDKIVEEPAFTAEVKNIEKGTLYIEINEPGKLYINDNFVKDVAGDGSIVSVSLIPGSYQVEVRLEDGSVRKRYVEIFSKEICHLSFTADIKELLKERKNIENEYASALAKCENLKKAGWATFGVSLASMVTGTIFYGCGAGADSNYQKSIVDGETREVQIDYYEAKSDFNTAGTVFMGAGSVSLFTSIGLLVNNKSQVVEYYEKLLAEINIKIEEAGGAE